MNHQATDFDKTEQWVNILKVVSLALVVVGIIWGGSTFFKSQKESRSVKAFSALAAADLIEMKALKDVEVLSQDPIEALKESPSELQESYVQALEAVVESHSGTTAAHLAALRLGRWFLEFDNLASAKDIYSALVKATEGNRSDLLYFSMSSEALSVVLEKEDKYEEALEVLDRALKESKIPLKPLLLLSRARVLTLLDQKAEAKDVYAEVLRDYPNSTYSQQAQALSVKVSL